MAVVFLGKESSLVFIEVLEFVSQGSKVILCDDVKIASADKVRIFDILTRHGNLFGI